VDLALTEEQDALVASYTQLLAKESSPEQVLEAEPSGFDPDLWRSLAEVGTVPMGVAEADGGWGASLLDLALVAEQVGRAAASAPVIETQVAARLLAATGTTAALAALEPVLAGERLVTLALHRPVAGTARLVPAGAVADAVLVLDGERLLLVPNPAEGRRLVENLASAPLADVEVGSGATELAAGPAAVERFEAAIDEWLVLTAAAVVGSSSAALDLACTYAAERRAFGAAIGSFQAISHGLADSATDLDGARLLVQKAAWSLDGGLPRGRELAAMAFAFSSRAAEAATYHALHVHGGYGFMLEYDVQLHYRRSRGWPRAWGDADAGFRRAGDARYATAGEGR
jgi:alkylation response protein AidB-like acyl-CoA dehydrogenase